VHLWNSQYDPKTRLRRHTATAGFGHALLAPLVLYAFRDLRISAAVWEHGPEWWSIHSDPTLQSFEAEHSVDTERDLYNGRQLALACKRRKTIRGEHGGHSDLYAPIVAGGKVVAVLVAGPFFTARPTGAEILNCWRLLSGRQGHMADPEFASYLAANLSMLVLDGGKALTFEKFLGCLARLMSGEGDAAALANQAEALALELGQVRLFERVGEAVRMMVDDRSQRTWHSASHAYRLGVLGLSRVADHVMVGLSTNRKPELDPVEETVRRDGFQRSAFELARSMGDVISGRVGEHGVVFLSGAKGTAERKRQKLLDLAERARTLARQRFGLSLHFGASVAPGSVPLSRSYQAALEAAESALAQRTPIVFADSGSRRSTEPLRHLRDDLSAEAEGHPERLGARFDRYLEAVAAHCGYRMDAALGHLEAGFERLTEPLASRGPLDKKSLSALSDTLDRAAQEARTIGELFSAYRRAVQDVVAAVERPVAARQDRSLRVAVEYIHQHYVEPLRLERVAKMAGFTASHFSKLFIKREEMPFEQYVRGLRIERARQLLSSSEINVTRISELSGFNTPQYFCRVFRRMLGVTPLEYRKNPRKMSRARLQRSSSANLTR